MAQRAVDIWARYFSCLSARWDMAFFSIGKASRQRPFDARLMPCSAEGAALTFAGACACDCAARSRHAAQPKKRIEWDLDILKGRPGLSVCEVYLLAFYPNALKNRARLVIGAEQD